ncbi:MAG: hypothetical protein R2771_11575 [Saprospiraceae bacterium]
MMIDKEIIALEAIAGNFDAEESVYAGYLMYNQNISKEFSLRLFKIHQLVKLKENIRW